MLLCKQLCGQEEISTEYLQDSASRSRGDPQTGIQCNIYTIYYIDIVYIIYNMYKIYVQYIMYSQCDLI